MKEIWRYIPSYEHFYEVSNFGRVRSVERVVMRKDGRFMHCDSVILKPFKGNTCNYLSVQLSINNKPQKFMIHRLVACTFLGLSNNSDLEVNHKDGNTFNNKLNNLEIVTHQQNIDHSVRNNLKNDYGENSSNAKLTNAEADNIRCMWKKGVKQKDIAELYGVCKQTICNIVHNKRYLK